MKKYLLNGLPEDADVLKQALLDYYQPNTLLDSDQFQLSELIGTYSPSSMRVHYKVKLRRLYFV